MLAEFRNAPKPIKVAAMQAFSFSVFFFYSVVPHDGFRLNEHSVTYAEWWLCGAGPLAASVGIFFPLAGTLLLRKSPYARPLYVLLLASLILIPNLLWGYFLHAVLGATIVAAICYFLYSNEASTYFASNKSFKADGVPPRP